MMTLLSRWVRPRTGRALAHWNVTVYSREGCGCCRKALDLLKTYQGRHGFSIEEVDVDSDPALAARHGSTVPVVAVNGKARFKGVVNPVLLERLLTAEGRGQ